MSASVNKVILIGHLGADPEIKSFQNGGRVCNLRLATSESWTDKQSGEKRERTEWHSVVLNNDGLIGVAERYLKKGSKIYVEGHLRTRKWQDKNGNDRWSTEIILSGYNGRLVMLGGAAGASSGGQSRGAAAGNSGAASGGSNTGQDQDPYGDLDDEVAF